MGARVHRLRLPGPAGGAGRGLGHRGVRARLPAAADADRPEPGADVRGHSEADVAGMWYRRARQPPGGAARRGQGGGGGHRRPAGPVGVQRGGGAGGRPGRPGRPGHPSRPCSSCASWSWRGWCRSRRWPSSGPADPVAGPRLGGHLLRRQLRGAPPGQGGRAAAVRVLAETADTATRTPTTSRPPWRRCGASAARRTASGRPPCGSPSTRANPGRTPGPWGGLGSAHTPAPGMQAWAEPPVVRG